MLRFEYGKSLLEHTSFKIGGRAFCWAEPDNQDEILEAVRFSEKEKRPLFVIGRGSNVLIHDKGFDGVVISLGRGFDYIDVEGNCILKVGSGVPVSKLAVRTMELQMAGCEFLSGIPGSFGGAVVMNAGVRDRECSARMIEIKDILVDVDVLDFKTRDRQTLDKDDILFGYRSSDLDGKCILSARIQLRRDSKDLIAERAQGFLKNRVWLQDIGFPSAGSIFKNPDIENPAGKLIEQCGLKGKRIGGAEILNAHANIIVNTGGAKAQDVQVLSALLSHSNL